MKRYTIYRKLFAFNAGSWEAIKEHRGESPEADKQYEAYKRKYGKEINEHEAGRSNNRSTNTSDSTRRGNSSYKSSNNQRTNTSSSNRNYSWEDCWEEFKKGFDERNRKYREQRQQTEENFKKWEERSSARDEEIRRKAEKLREEARKSQKRWDEHARQERETYENLRNKWKSAAEESARKTSNGAFEKAARKRASRNGKIGLGVMAGLGIAGLGAASYILDREEEKSKKKKKNRRV